MTGSVCCFAEEELWFYASCDEWYMRGDTTYVSKRSMWTFYIDDRRAVELNGHTYIQLASNPTAYPTIRVQRGASEEVQDRWYTIGIRREDGRVYANYEEYMEYVKYRYTHEPPYDFLMSHGNPDYIPYHLTDDGEIILYDYNMSVGDSYRHVDGYADITVVSKDMVALSDGKYRRRLTLSNGLVLIEGVGCINSTGLLLDYLNPSEECLKQFSYLDTYIERGNKLFTFKQMPIEVVSQGIGDTEAISKEATVSSFLDLQGRRLSTQPRHGLYIRGGRKYVAR